MVKEFASRREPHAVAYGALVVPGVTPANNVLCKIPGLAPAQLRE